MKKLWQWIGSWFYRPDPLELIVVFWCLIIIAYTSVNS